MSDRFREPFLRWAPLLGWCGVIFIFSGMPGEAGDPTPGLFLRAKLAHLVEYAVLFLLARRAIEWRRPPSPGRWLAAVLFCLAFAASDEYHQGFIAYREPRASDVAIDAAGTALGLLMARWRTPHYQQGRANGS